MGILEIWRTKFGSGVPNSQVLTRGLGDLNERINKNRADAAAIEASIPEAVIASIDGAATERRKLERLDSEHKALVAAADATRREIAEARRREAAADFEARWQRAEEKADELRAAGKAADETYSRLVAAVRLLIQANEALIKAVPAPARDWSPTLLSDGLALFLEKLGTRAMLPKTIEEQCLMALKGRPKKESATGGDAATQGS